LEILVPDSFENLKEDYLDRAEIGNNELSYNIDV
jgi:hypothetical protein